MRTLPLLSAAALALVAGACATPRPDSRASPLVGRAVDIAALDLSGRQVTIPRGDGKVRIVDFWATWCDPCRDQLPFLGRLASEYGPQGLSVDGVSFDEDRAALERFLQRTPVSFEILWDKGGEGLSDALQIQRLPTTLLLDRRGVVREVHLGHDASEERKIEDGVRRLLAEPAAAP